LPQILPLFPNNISTFVDLFGGGGEVSLNVEAERVIYNDKCKPLVNIFQNLDDDFIANVEYMVAQYSLSKTNKEGFLKLREDYNSASKTSRQDAVMLYCLLSHAFNYQIAFNSSGKYNMPSGAGRSYFSPQMKIKLQKYIDRIKEINIEFQSNDFHNLNFDNLPRDAFFYCDPPYLITTGAYERDYFCKWSEDYERELYNILDILDYNGYKFALSNVVEHKGKSNDILKEWSKGFNIHYLNKDYKNCNYQRQDRSTKTVEVLITNY
jgi:DNA adenine methylase Dam